MSSKALIVLAHPAELSLSRLIAETAVATLTASGRQPSLLDLYAHDFDPVLTRLERSTYYTEAANFEAFKSHADLLSHSEILVLVFPTWWFGLPAILKGWLDRVFAPGIAFDHASDFGPIKPRLVNLRKVVVVTTLGSPAWIDWLVMRRPVRRILKTAVFGLCAPQAKFRMLSFYSAEKPDPARVESFRQKVARALA